MEINPAHLFFLEIPFKILYIQQETFFAFWCDSDAAVVLQEFESNNNNNIKLTLPKTVSMTYRVPKERDPRSSFTKGIKNPLNYLIGRNFHGFEFFVHLRTREI